MSYRSNIDTPFAEKEVYQHMVQTYLDVTVRDQYPMRVYLTTRFSNSAYFPNFSDLGLQFNQSQFARQVKEQIKQRLLAQLAAKDTAALRDLLKKNLRDEAQLQQWLRDPAVFERMVEERERVFWAQQRKAAGDSTHATAPARPVLPVFSLNDKFGRSAPAATAVPAKDSLPPAALSRLDSLKQVPEPMADKYEHAKLLLDSLKKETKTLTGQYDKWKQDNNPNTLRNEIDGIDNVQQLRQKMQAWQVPDSVLPKGYKKLFAVKSFGIGRNILDYSALTARNISVTGVQVEYNPSYYAAFASGFVDYRFRDYVVQTGGPRQYATVLRFGQGTRDGNHLIFSYYFGSRRLYNTATIAQTGTPPNYNLVGYSLEGRYRLNRNHYLDAELAKSSLPYYNSTNNKGTLLSQAMQFSDNTNMAWRLQWQSFFPATYTRVTGSWQRAGSNFQSFSVFTSGTTQTNWMARVEQPFFNRHLNIVASIRTNEYTNPYIGYSFSGNTVFKSIQATLRLRKWPTLSVGYYPSSQLTKLSDTQYYENQFYTLVGTMTHFYRFNKLSMNSTLVYSRFYNRAADSGFVYFNTRNWLFNQSIIAGRFTWLAGLSESANTDYTLYGVEAGMRIRIRQWLSLQGGTKYSQQTVYNREVWGYSGGITLKLARLGEVQGTLDKGFIPGTAKALVPNNTGRISYFKIF